MHQIFKDYKKHGSIFGILKSLNKRKVSVNSYSSDFKPNVFRVDGSRAGLEVDSSVNVSWRIYVVPTSDIYNNFITKVLRGQSPKLISGVISKYAYIVTKSLQDASPRKILHIPTRICVFVDSKDEFISFHIGFKIKNMSDKTSIDNQRVKFNIILNGLKEQLGIVYCTNNSPYKAQGLFDIQHCERGPVYNWEAKYCKEISSQFFPYYENDKSISYALRELKRLEESSASAPSSSEPVAALPSSENSLSLNILGSSSMFLNDAGEEVYPPDDAVDDFGNALKKEGT